MSGAEQTGADDSSDGAARMESAGGAVVLEVVDDTAILTATGALDLALAPKLHQMVDRAARLRPRLVVIDLSGLGFLASAGMAELVRAHRAQPERSELRIVADGRLVLRPLQLTRLIDELAVFPTLRAALAAR